MAAGLLARRAADRGLPVRVRSAGLLPGSVDVSEPAVTVLRQRGIDLSDHRSTQIERPHIEGADLVLAMTREHVREVVMRDPSAWPKTFTLKELVRRGVGVGPKQVSEPLGDWLARVGDGRNRTELLGSSSVDDVADPYRQPTDIYEQTAVELDTLLNRLVSLVWPA